MASASDDRMQVDEAGSTLSSSPISSAPVSPHSNGFSGSIAVSTQPHTTNLEGGVSISTPATATTPHTAATLQNNTSSATQVDKPKRQRKKKEIGADGKPIDDGKPKVSKPRKPREPKAAVNGSATNTTARKKIKTEADATPRQSTITEMVNKHSPVNTTPRQVESNLPSTLPVPPPLSGTPTPRPATSGQKYDPIRGMTMDAYARPQPPSSSATANATAHPPVNRASASPAIASLIDPPSITASTTSAAPSPQPLSTQLFAASSAQQLSSTTQAQSSASPVIAKVQPAAESVENMVVDSKSPNVKLVTKDKLDPKPQSKASSTSHTPKINNAARSSPPAPKGTGSGLLSTSDLFGGTSAMDSERKSINIDIHIKLDPNGGNHINVAQEIIKKYGREAINPRAAAHRERLLQVMAAASKVEGNSGDDMSIDLMSDMGDDSNIEMGGMDDGSAAGADGEKPRKRRKKVEEYDLDDEFIDDTELAWQQQAAVAKDGFFVYSGPLVPEGETARVEANTGARGKGGRGRGRGKAGASSTTHASLAEKKEPVAAATATRGRGGRVKAPAAPRKRATKAEKEKAEAEKAAKAEPSTAPVPPPLAVPPAQLGVPGTAGTTA